MDYNVPVKGNNRYSLENEERQTESQDSIQVQLYLTDLVPGFLLALYTIVSTTQTHKGPDLLLSRIFSPAEMLLVPVKKLTGLLQLPFTNSQYSCLLLYGNYSNRIFVNHADEEKGFLHQKVLGVTYQSN